MNDIAGNIKNLRKEKKFSQEQFAQRLHVTRQTVSAWERGLSQPGLETLHQIARVLEVEPERLLYGKAPRRPIYRKSSFLPVLFVPVIWFLGTILIGLLLSLVLGGGSGDVLLLAAGQILLGMLVVFCYCSLLDEIRNREYYSWEDRQEDTEKSGQE